MKIIRIEYAATINKGNYENDRITLLREEVFKATGERRRWGAERKRVEDVPGEVGS